VSTIEGLQHSGIPCAQVLSVAGFLVIRSLFTLGGGLFLGGITYWITLGYERFRTFLTLLMTTVRTSRNLNYSHFMTDHGPGAGSMRNDEQYVHRCTHGGRTVTVAHLPTHGGRTVTVVHILLSPTGGGPSLLCTFSPTHGRRNITVVHILLSPMGAGGTVSQHTPGYSTEGRPTTRV